MRKLLEVISDSFIKFFFHLFYLNFLINWSRESIKFTNLGNYFPIFSNLILFPLIGI